MNRYVLDVILIVGLLIGTIGGFCLAQALTRKLLGEQGNRLLQTLVACAVMVPLYIVIALTWRTLSPAKVYSASPSYLRAYFAFLYGLNLPEEVALFGVIGVLLSIYAVVFGEGFVWAYEDFRKFTLRGRLGCVAEGAAGLAILLVASSLGSVYILHVSISLAQLSAFLLQVVGGLGVLALLAFLRKAGDVQLQVIGLVFTLLGVATQFLPPVLDLLNIPDR